MEYHSSVEITFSTFRREIDVIVDYEIIDDKIFVNTIRLKNEADAEFQPIIDGINMSLDYEHLHPWILGELKERKEDEDIETYLNSSAYEGFTGVFD